MEKGQFKEAITIRQEELRRAIGKLKDQSEIMVAMADAAHQTTLLLQKERAALEAINREPDEILIKAIESAESTDMQFDSHLEEIDRQFNILKGSLAENDYWYTSSLLND